VTRDLTTADDTRDTPARTAPTTPGDQWKPKPAARDTTALTVPAETAGSRWNRFTGASSGGQVQGQALRNRLRRVGGPRKYRVQPVRYGCLINVARGHLGGEAEDSGGFGAVSLG
jgi:hypothetical protein